MTEPIASPDVRELIERLRIPHYLGDDAKARLPEPAADLIYLLRHERKEAADSLLALRQEVERLRHGEIDAASLINPVPAGVGPTHRHTISGGDYVLIGHGKMQSETWQEPVPFTRLGLVDRVDMREVAIYRSVDDGSLWVRPREEFEDGRFEALRQAPDAEQGAGK